MLIALYDVLCGFVYELCVICIPSARIYGFIHMSYALYAMLLTLVYVILVWWLGIIVNGASLRVRAY